MNIQTATFASGCFWCTEAVFQRIRGVQSVVSGYTGGTKPHPTYEEVCSGQTGHLEALQVTFDADVVPYEQLLKIFFTTHDPTQVNQQGHDIGPQYQSALFAHTDDQATAAREMIARLNAEKVFPKPIATELRPATEFYRAESYHQNYFRTHPEQAYCQAVISPKVAKLRASFADWLVD